MLAQFGGAEHMHTETGAVGVGQLLQQRQDGRDIQRWAAQQRLHAEERVMH